MSSFQFLPHPEAHAMNWNDLLPPLQEAMRHLLVRLAGAVETVKWSIDHPNEAAGEEITASCFLVYGDRGTGKSTVLLSAKAAACTETAAGFFGHKGERGDLWEDTKTSAKALHESGLVWLDVLDMEPLPRDTNLLATLLVRLRNALYAPGGETRPPTPTSILEEGTDSARHRLDRLIKDATLMWEDIEEPDTRSRANRQIEAADIYARFGERFRSAMGALSQELGRYKGRGNEYHPIVLPIDNIDRSTDHLYNIIKLAQMVACPHLWIVMAGDREDIGTFLERAYWKELIQVGEGAGGLGKVGARGEDEALVMARRQAAAASHKLLPASHRIEVNLVRPVHTLEFPNVGGEDGRTKREPLRELLAKIAIPNLGNGPRATLLDLFDAAGYVEHPEGSGESLTLAAKLALHLPARGVNNLWQLAHSAALDELTDPVAEDERGPEKADRSERQKEFKAERVARTMLRNLIAESKMSSDVGQRLQEHVIQRFAGGATVLNFRDPNPRLKVIQVAATDFSRCVTTMEAVAEGGKERNYAVRSTLTIRGDREFDDFSLAGGATRESGDDEDCAKADEERLPPLVAGWLAILHDVVMWAPNSWVLRPGIDLSYLELGRFVRVSHEVVHLGGRRTRASPKPLWWPVPEWNSFLAYDVFGQKWKRWERRIKQAVQGNPAARGDSLPRLLAVAWVACVLDTFWTLAPLKWMPRSWPRLDEVEVHERIEIERDKIASTLGLKPETMAEVLKDEAKAPDSVAVAEQKVIELAEDLYRILVEEPPSSENTRTTFLMEEGTGFVKDWLDRKLPLLLSCLYVPLSDKGRTERHQAMERAYDTRIPRLAKAWRENSPFILADMEATMAGMFGLEAEATGGKHKTKATISTLDSSGIPGHFADLHRLLS